MRRLNQFKAVSKLKSPAEPDRKANKGCILLALFLFRFKNNRITEFQFRKKRSYMFQVLIAISIPVFSTGSQPRPARAAAQDFPPKISQKNACSVYSEYAAFLPFCSFCYQEQNERNDIPLIPKTE